MTERATYEINLKDGFTSPLSALESKMNRLESGIGGLNGAFSGLGQTVLGVFGGSLLAGGVEGILTAVRDLGVESVKVARDFTNMRDAIAFASGNDAEKNLKFLDDTIVRLGLDMESTFKGFKTFQGALMGTALEGDKGREIFNAVSEAASVMKLSAEQTEGTFLALGQMISKGNVQAEELRGQLGERLPGAFNIFARSLGVSTQKLGKMLQNGEVLAEKALPLFAAELRKTFSSGVSKAQETFNANMNRFNNWILTTKMNLGNSLIPALNDLVVIIPKLDFGPLLFTFQQLGTEIRLLIGAFSDLFGLADSGITKFDTFSAALRYFTFLLRVPWTVIRVGIQLFTQLINIISASVDTFKGLANVLYGIYTQDFKRMNEGIDQIGKSWSTFLKKASSDAGAFFSEEKQGWAKLFSPFGEDPLKPSSAMGGGGTTTGSPGMSAADKAKAAGVEKIHSGTRNITININKVIESVKFEKYNGQSESQIMEMIKRALVTSVNDVNIVAQ